MAKAVTFHGFGNRLPLERTISKLPVCSPKLCKFVSHFSTNGWFMSLSSIHLDFSTIPPAIRQTLPATEQSNHVICYGMDCVLEINLGKYFRKYLPFFDSHQALPARKYSCNFRSTLQNHSIGYVYCIFRFAREPDGAGCSQLKIQPGCNTAEPEKSSSM